MELGPMMVGLRGILQVAAIVCFVLAALNVDMPMLHLTPLGLALFVASVMVPKKDLSLAG